MPGQEIVVIGDEDAIFGLGLIGLKGQPVASLEEARKAIQSAISEPATGLVLLTENWAGARPEVCASAAGRVCASCCQRNSRQRNSRHWHVLQQTRAPPAGPC